MLLPHILPHNICLSVIHCAPCTERMKKLFRMTDMIGYDLVVHFYTLHAEIKAGIVSPAAIVNESSGGSGEGSKGDVF